MKLHIRTLNTKKSNYEFGFLKNSQKIFVAGVAVFILLYMQTEI